MTNELPKVYEPDKIESIANQLWLDTHGFDAEPPSDPASNETPYTIVIPPPNVTGILHMGHALDNTLQDILIR